MLGHPSISERRGCETVAPVAVPIRPLMVDGIALPQSRSQQYNERMSGLSHSWVLCVVLASCSGPTSSAQSINNTSCASIGWSRGARQCIAHPAAGSVGCGSVVQGYTFHREADPGP